MSLAQRSGTCTTRSNANLDAEAVFVNFKFPQSSSIFIKSGFINFGHGSLRQFSSMLCFVNLGFCRFHQFSSPVCKGCGSAASEAAEQIEDYNLQAFCHHVVCFLKKPFLR